MSTPTTHTMRAGDLVAVFWPERGMICTSLLHRGCEILRLVDDMDEASASGRSVGIPLLHPYANRLAGPGYSIDGREVKLDPESPWLLRDWNDVLLHGVPWSKLDWSVVHADATSLTSHLAWNRPELIAIFPFEHELEMRAVLEDDALTITTALTAGLSSAVPVSFGFHPYVGIPGLSRDQWRIELPSMQSIGLDARLLPTGARAPFPAVDAPLAKMDFDHGFALDVLPATMSIAGAGRRISVDFLHGYPYAQIYAPQGNDYISLEPMTAPTNALRSGEDLPRVPPGGRFEAAFRVRVEMTRPQS